MSHRRRSGSAALDAAHDRHEACERRPVARCDRPAAASDPRWRGCLCIGSTGSSRSRAASARNEPLLRRRMRLGRAQRSIAVDAVCSARVSCLPTNWCGFLAVPTCPWRRQPVARSRSATTIARHRWPDVFVVGKPAASVAHISRSRRGGWRGGGSPAPDRSAGAYPTRSAEPSAAEQSSPFPEGSCGARYAAGARACASER